MQEDEVWIFENGIWGCPHCIVGIVEYVGGPLGVGIPGAIDPNVLFLHKCDVCEKSYRRKNEPVRLRMIDYYRNEYFRDLDI